MNREEGFSKNIWKVGEIYNERFKTVICQLIIKTNVIKGEITTRVVFVSKKVFESYKAQINPLTRDLFFETSNILLEGLHVTNQISVDLFEQLSGYLIAGKGLFNISSIDWSSTKIESLKDRCLFQYDYFFPSYQLRNIALDLDMLNMVQEYPNIPQEYKRNKVFRHFKCYFSEEPIRYPVIIVDENNQPHQPLKLFERKTLLNRLIRQLDLYYPGTQIPIDLVQVREHLGVRTIIEDEIRRLHLEE